MPSIPFSLSLSRPPSRPPSPPPPGSPSSDDDNDPDRGDSAFDDDSDYPHSRSLHPHHQSSRRYASFAPRASASSQHIPAPELLFALSSAPPSGTSSAAITPMNSRPSSPSPLAIHSISYGSNSEDDSHDQLSSPLLGLGFSDRDRRSSRRWPLASGRRRWWDSSRSKRRKRDSGLRGWKRLVGQVIRHPLFPTQPTTILLSFLVFTAFALSLTLLLKHILNPDKAPLPWRSYCSLTPSFPPPAFETLPPVGVFVGVFSIDSGVERRMLVRSTWASHHKSRGTDGGTDRTVVRFVIGTPRAEWERRVKLEMETYKDMVILPMEENMNSGKSHAFFTWAHTNGFVPPPSPFHHNGTLALTPSNSTIPAPPRAPHDPPAVLRPSSAQLGAETGSGSGSGSEIAADWVRPNFVIKADDDSFVMLAELEARLRLEWFQAIADASPLPTPIPSSSLTLTGAGTSTLTSTSTSAISASSASLPGSGSAPGSAPTGSASGTWSASAGLPVETDSHGASVTATPSPSSVLASGSGTVPGHPEATGTPPAAGAAGSQATAPAMLPAMWTSPGGVDMAHLARGVDPMIYWGYLVKSRFMAGELYALSSNLVEYVATTPALKSMTRGAEDKQTAKWMRIHPRANEVRWRSERCWIYDHPRANTVYSHGFLFPSEVSRVRHETTHDIPPSQMHLFPSSPPTIPPSLSSSDASLAFSTVSRFGMRYVPPMGNLTAPQEIEALVEGSALSRLRDMMPREEITWGDVERAWALREGRKERYAGTGGNVGGTVVVHFIKRNEWFLEAALALLEGEEVVERPPVVPEEPVSMGGVRVKVGLEEEEIGDDERRTSGEDATPALVVDEPLPVVETRSESEPGSEESSLLPSPSAPSTSISPSTITTPLSDNGLSEELASSS
ncbi:glycosyltransferase family 31 protein [Botryobasidium botryosum FD-172 SS1]|uniref:Glycosyltransferase family 31 protein n=1 Tax=Botryobasidium botryosum (strain FD-172 SS1) TaxID=930990 RepID=A0A067MXZ5_BOTB1|nr:glycosyltransferase family 31 protein [Botryobasidium botryosum FD-172 SS1]